jgi:hypothetical protein
VHYVEREREMSSWESKKVATGGEAHVCMRTKESNVVEQLEANAICSRVVMFTYKTFR